MTNGGACFAKCKAGYAGCILCEIHPLVFAILKTCITTRSGTRPQARRQRLATTHAQTDRRPALSQDSLAFRSLVCISTRCGTHARNSPCGVRLELYVCTLCSSLLSFFSFQIPGRRADCPPASAITWRVLPASGAQPFEADSMLHMLLIKTHSASEKLLASFSERASAFDYRA